MRPAAWPAPAKLNLFLRITGRRPDGYHDLQTVFQLLDLADRVQVARRADGAIHRLSETPGVAPEDDLVVRAARLLQEHARVPWGADIILTKRIPMGGGLGGGSSDAATALVALNSIWEAGLSRDVLAQVGLGLGADVPVFVRGHAAWAEGVGERLTPVCLEEAWYLVLHPGCHVATAAIFQRPDLTRNTPPIKIPALFPDAGVPVAVAEVMARTANDCEPVVRAAYPQVDGALRWLGRFSPARMTGTGACVFAPFRREEQAREVLEQVPAPWTGFVARGLNRSPLLRLAESAAP